MDAEQPRDFLNRVIPVDFHEAGIGMAIAHSSTRILPRPAV
jgi:hypothetical protein